VALLGEFDEGARVALRQIGGAALMQEPNIKESAGGLRDLHELLWASRIVYGGRRSMVLVDAGAFRTGREGHRLGLLSFCSACATNCHFMTSAHGRPLARLTQEVTASALADSVSCGRRRFSAGLLPACARLHRLCASHLQRAVAGRQEEELVSPAPRATAAIAGS